MPSIKYQMQATMEIAEFEKEVVAVIEVAAQNLQPELRLKMLQHIKDAVGEMVSITVDQLDQRNRNQQAPPMEVTELPSQT